MRNTPINPNCIDDIKGWKSRNFLELNRDKTPNSQAENLSSLLLKHNEEVKDLGIILDTDLSFDNH